jgi:regulator of cell morphogenesis and NO signaling
MSRLTPEHTVAEIATGNMARTKVFENFGIDYCCGGEIPLREACVRRGIDPVDVLSALSASDQSAAADSENLDQAGPSKLASMIFTKHHTYLWDELPRLDDLHVHVVERHAQQQPHLMKSLELFRELRTELEEHMLAEEQYLFPLCSSIEHGRTQDVQTAVGSLLENYEAEHQRVGKMLHDLRTMHKDYHVAEGSCRKQQALLARLQALEQDTHLHIHKENNILFRKLRELNSVQA